MKTIIWCPICKKEVEFVPRKYDPKYKNWLFGDMICKKCDIVYQKQSIHKYSIKRMNHFLFECAKSVFKNE